jgi:hypothetical protein
MQTMRGFVAAALAGAAVVAAGCGGSSSSTEDSVSTASLAPKDAAAWISIDTDPDSAQWQSLDTLLKKIPGAEAGIDDPDSSPFAGARFRTEVLPAIGTQLVLVVPAGDPDPVMLVKPSDSDKLDALLAKTDEHEVTGDVDGWTAIAASQKELDAYTGALGDGTLASSDTFTSAMEGLPEQALATGFVNGRSLASGLGGLDGLGGSVAALSALPGVATGTSGTGSLLPFTGSASGSAATGTCTITVNGVKQSCNVAAGTSASAGLGVGSVSALPQKATDFLRSAGFAVTVGDDTIRFEAQIDVPHGQVPEAYAPTLLDDVPSDALVAVSFHGGESLSKQLGASAGADTLKEREQQLGVSFDDLARALEGEGVLYVRPGAPIPEITVAVKAGDPSATKHVFDTVVAKLGGTAAQSLPIPGFELSTAIEGDVVIASTSKSAASSFGDGPSLTGTERFKTAADAVELGDMTSGFLYVDVHGLGPLLQTAVGALGGSSGSGASGADDALKSLASLDFLALNAVAENGRVRVEGALRTS